MSAYESADEMRRKQLAQHNVRTKAETHPEELDDEDLKTLDGAITSKLMSEGKLAHLGLGRPRGRR